MDVFKVLYNQAAQLEQTVICYDWLARSKRPYVGFCIEVGACYQKGRAKIFFFHNLDENVALIARISCS